LMLQNDGPMLEALKSLHGRQIYRPERQQDWPDRARLEQRFEVFQNHG